MYCHRYSLHFPMRSDFTMGNIDKHCPRLICLEKIVPDKMVTSWNVESSGVKCGVECASVCRLSVCCLQSTFRWGWILLWGNSPPHSTRLHTQQNSPPHSTNFTFDSTLQPFRRTISSCHESHESHDSRMERWIKKIQWNQILMNKMKWKSRKIIQLTMARIR